MKPSFLPIYKLAIMSIVCQIMGLSVRELSDKYPVVVYVYYNTEIESYT